MSEELKPECVNCTFCSDVSEGYEYGQPNPIYACEKEGKEFVSNLKSFPFKKEQPCFVMNQLLTMTAEDWKKYASNNQQELSNE